MKKTVLGAMIKSFKKKNPNKKYGRRNKKEALAWNVYGEKYFDNHLKNFDRVHYKFKYKLLVPLLHLVRRWVKKPSITDEPHNKNVKIFDEVFDDSVEDWNVLYRRWGVNKNKTVKFWKERAVDEKNNANSLLKVMKDAMLMVIQKDTAYKEFFNILMFNLSKAMLEEYGDKKKHPRGVGHLMYASNHIFDIHYKILYKTILEKPHIILEDAEKEVKRYMSVEGWRERSAEDMKK